MNAPRPTVEAADDGALAAGNAVAVLRAGFEGHAGRSLALPVAGAAVWSDTLPVRRLDLDVGQEEQIDVAWVKFPELRVDRGRQTYARLAATTWRYTSGGFTAELTVD